MVQFAGNGDFGGTGAYGASLELEDTALICAGGSLFASYPFTTQWTVSGDATARTITLPLVNGYAFNFVVDWGDGTTPSLVTAYNDANRIHTYAVNGTYIVKIYGVCEGWSFNNGGDKLKITGLISGGRTPTFSGFKYLVSGFYGCSNITSTIPDDMLRNASACDNLFALFRSCSGITGSIPTDLLKYVTEVTDISYLLYDCSGLTGSIPTDLLRYVTKATNLRYLLWRCSGLTGTVPTDFLRYVTLATNINSLIRSCSGLTGALPANFLKYVTQVTDAGYLLQACSGITGYGADLCRDIVLCTDFSYMMQNCYAMQQRSDTFYRPGEEATRFAGKTINFTGCFYRTSFTGTQGTAPDLWNATYAGVTSTSCWTGAGNSLTSLTNYASIPAGWK